MEKTAKAEGAEHEVPMRDVIGKRPMSKLSKDDFTEEKVSAVRGILRKFNDELFPELPIKKGEGVLNKLLGRNQISDELFVFVDRGGKEASQQLLRLPTHGRNLCFNVKFSDAEGNIYNYIDIKGAGMPENDERGKGQTILTTVAPQIIGRRVYVRGMGDWEEAAKDWEMSEFLRKKGVDVAPPIAIVEVKEFILKDGKRMSVKEALRKGVIPYELEYQEEIYRNRPALYFRAFTETVRLSDPREEGTFEKFAKEQGKSLGDYLDWLGGKMADNIIKMHKAGVAHKNLIPHNWTLDGHIVDFDTVEPINSDNMLLDVSLTIGGMHLMHGVRESLSYDNVVRLQEAFLGKYLMSSCIKKDEIILLYNVYDTQFKFLENDVIKSLYKETMRQITKFYNKRFGEGINHSKNVGEESEGAGKKSTQHV